MEVLDEEGNRRRRSSVSILLECETPPRSDSIQQYNPHATYTTGHQPQHSSPFHIAADSEILEDSICRVNNAESPESTAILMLNHPVNNDPRMVDTVESSHVSSEEGLLNSTATPNLAAPKTSGGGGSSSAGGAGIDIRLQKFLACGSFGKVYLGIRSDEPNKPIAVKNIQYDHSNPGTAVSLGREISMMSKTRHPNVVEFLGFRQDSGAGDLYIFMEYVAGGSMASLLSHFGPLPENIVRLWVRHILTGVGYLHSSRMVHRDIKGANILLQFDEHQRFPVVAKMADFGCSRMLGLTAVQFDSLQGTPHWMAPEVIKQTGHSRPADIWSVACTMVEMLTGGKTPFHEYRQPTSAMLAIANYNNSTTLNLPPTLSKECDGLIRLMMDPDPTQRPSAKDILSGSCGFFLSSPELEVNAVFEDEHCRRLAELIIDYVRDRATAPPQIVKSKEGAEMVLRNVVFVTPTVETQPPQNNKGKGSTTNGETKGAQLPPLGGSNTGKTPVKATRSGSLLGRNNAQPSRTQSQGPTSATKANAAAAMRKHVIPPSPGAQRQGGGNAITPSSSSSSALKHQPEQPTTTTTTTTASALLGVPAGGAVHHVTTPTRRTPIRRPLSTARPVSQPRGGGGF